jgi:hypothetical protein
MGGCQACPSSSSRRVRNMQQTLILRLLAGNYPFGHRSVYGTSSLVPEHNKSKRFTAWNIAANSMMSSGMLLVANATRSET